MRIKRQRACVSRLEENVVCDEIDAPRRRRRQNSQSTPNQTGSWPAAGAQRQGGGVVGAHALPSPQKKAKTCTRDTPPGSAGKNSKGQQGKEANRRAVTKTGGLILTKASPSQRRCGLRCRESRPRPAAGRSGPPSSRSPSAAWTRRRCGPLAAAMPGSRQR
jgi:hypothetical protein